MTGMLSGKDWELLREAWNSRVPIDDDLVYRMAPPKEDVDTEAFNEVIRRFVMARQNDAMLDRAKELVVRYFNEQSERTDNFKLTKDDVFIVWFCKTLQNWKALVSTTVSDGMYYEVTHNGDKNETYLDAYKKWQNVRYPDA